MIRMIRTDSGHSAPVILCDACKEPITDPAMAMVTWKYIEGVGDQAELWHLHKGQCDRNFKSVIGADNPWQEMQKHLVHLCHNAGFPPKEMTKHDKFLDYLENEVGQLP